MIVGFDVHHGSKSLGAMVSTTSDTLGSYFSSIVNLNGQQTEFTGALGAGLQRKLPQNCAC